MILESKMKQNNHSNYFLFHLSSFKSELKCHLLKEPLAAFCHGLPLLHSGPAVCLVVVRALHPSGHCDTGVNNGGPSSQVLPLSRTSHFLALHLSVSVSSSGKWK